MTSFRVDQLKFTILDFAFEYLAEKVYRQKNMQKGRVSRMLFLKCQRERKNVGNSISEINKRKKTLQNIGKLGEQGQKVQEKNIRRAEKQVKEERSRRRERLRKERRRRERKVMGRRKESKEREDKEFMFK